MSETIQERLRGPIKHPQECVNQRQEAADHIDALEERCEAYKGQVEAGSKRIAGLEADGFLAELKRGTRCMQCDNGTLVCSCGRYTQQEDNIVRKVSTFSQENEMKTVIVQFEVNIPDDMDMDDAQEWIGFEVGASRQMTCVHPQMEKDLEPIPGSFSVRGSDCNACLVTILE
jgi:hypothetical protein